MDRTITADDALAHTTSGGVPSVSIIIPAHNADRTLGRTLNALKDLPSSYELLIVNDHSSDDTVAVARAAGHEPILSRSVRNCSAARNSGVAATQGETLVFLDADVEVEAARLREMVRRFAASDAACLFAVYDRGDHLPGVVARFKNYWIRHSTLSAPRPPRWINTSLAIMRRRDFLAAGSFHEAFSVKHGGTDLFFGRQLAERCGPIIIDELTEVTHHKHFTLMSLLRNDFSRSRGWFRLALSRRGLAGVMRRPTLANVRRRFSLGVCAAGLALPLLFAGMFYPLALAAGIGGLIVQISANLRFFFDAARDGMRAWPLFPLLLYLDQLACAAGITLELMRRPLSSAPAFSTAGEFNEETVDESLSP